MSPDQEGDRVTLEKELRYFVDLYARLGVNLFDLAIVFGFPKSACLTSAGVGKVELVTNECLPESNHLSVSFPIICTDFLVSSWFLAVPIGHTLLMLGEHLGDASNGPSASTKKICLLLHFAQNCFPENPSIVADVLRYEVKLLTEVLDHIFGALAFVVVEPLFTKKLQVIGDLRLLRGCDMSDRVFGDLSFPADAEKRKGEKFGKRYCLHVFPYSYFNKNLKDSYTEICTNVCLTAHLLAHIFYLYYTPIQYKSQGVNKCSGLSQKPLNYRLFTRYPLQNALTTYSGPSLSPRL